jgi:hypothetical protein
MEYHRKHFLPLTEDMLVGISSEEADKEIRSFINELKGYTFEHMMALTNTDQKLSARFGDFVDAHVKKEFQNYTVEWWFDCLTSTMMARYPSARMFEEKLRRKLHKIANS